MNVHVRRVHILASGDATVETVQGRARLGIGTLIFKILLAFTLFYSAISDGPHRLQHAHGYSMLQ